MANWVLNDSCINWCFFFVCRKSNAMSGLVRLVMTMKGFLNKISPTLNWSSTVLLGVSKCPFATIFWKAGGGPPFKIFCGTSNPILKWRLSVHQYQWGHQWLILRNLSRKGASSFCCSTGGLSIMVGISCFCQELIGDEVWFLCLWPLFGISWS